MSLHFAVSFSQGAEHGTRADNFSSQSGWIALETIHVVDLVQHSLQALFGALAGGILVTSAAAVILAGPAGHKPDVVRLQAEQVRFRFSKLQNALQAKLRLGRANLGSFRHTTESLAFLQGADLLRGCPLY